MANGPYVLRLTATDIAGRTSQTTILVEADTATKPTQYLRTETDLSVTLAGSVFNLVRSYDSLMAAQSGTFGYGWRLAEPGHGHPDDGPADRPRVDRDLQPVPDRHAGLPDAADRPARRLHLHADRSTRSTG